MDKIQLLQSLLNEEDLYDELLESLHTYAKQELQAEGGLPFWDAHPREHMRLMINQWLCKLILKVIVNDAN